MQGWFLTCMENMAGISEPQVLVNDQKHQKIQFFICLLNSMGEIENLEKKIKISSFARTRGCEIFALSFPYWVYAIIQY